MEEVSLGGGGGFSGDGMVSDFEKGYNEAEFLYNFLCPFSRDIIPNFFRISRRRREL